MRYAAVGGGVGASAAVIEHEGEEVPQVGRSTSITALLPPVVAPTVSRATSSMALLPPAVAPKVNRAKKEYCILRAYRLPPKKQKIW